MIAVVVVIVVLLSASAGLVLTRLVRGPTLLDRVVAVEVLVSVMVGSVGAEAAINRHATTLPILVILAMLGFVGSVALVRFVAEARS